MSTNKGGRPRAFRTLLYDAARSGTLEDVCRAVIVRASEDVDKLGDNGGVPEYLPRLIDTMAKYGLCRRRPMARAGDHDEDEPDGARDELLDILKTVQ